MGAAAVGDTLFPWVVHVFEVMISVAIVVLCKIGFVTVHGCGFVVELTCYSQTKKHFWHKIELSRARAVYMLVRIVIWRYPCVLVVDRLSRHRVV